MSESKNETTDEDIVEVLRLSGSTVGVGAVRRHLKTEGIAELYWLHARTIAKLRIAVEALSSIHDGRCVSDWCDRPHIEMQDAATFALMQIEGADAMIAERAKGGAA
ncbi:hypothetical protein [Hyphomicrobium sp. 2TAF46]|uniref:hypothetical protein n=1 Tax=Hyphomicrobium sp. 2TAF46 TaxID=3233019 RepID=UPI003F8F338F